MKKYSMTQEGTLFRITALRDVGSVEAGTVGGLIESEQNLSHDGRAWVYDDAIVCGHARVSGNAQVFQNARVYGNAEVFNNAKVSGCARVYGDAMVFGDATVHQNAQVFDFARVHELAKVCENAKVFHSTRIRGRAKVSGCARVYGDALVLGNTFVYDHARVYGQAIVDGNARVYENARVFGDALVSGDAKVSSTAVIAQGHRIQFGRIEVDLTLKENLKQLIKASLNVLPVKGVYTFYKHVYKYPSGVYRSLYDLDFIYTIGKVHTTKTDPDPSVSCTTGLHVGTPTYWEDQEGNAVLACLVKLENIIACQNGKIRCSELKVIEEVQDSDY